MDDLIYDQLADALARRGGGVPAIKSPLFRDLLATIFSDEDAQLAVRMPDAPVTAEDMAGVMNWSLDAVEKCFDIMARKGIIVTVKMGGKRIYILPPLIPGILELQMMKGDVNERTRKIAKLTYEYLAFLQELTKQQAGSLPTVPFARVIAVEQDIDGGTSVQPYDKLLEYVDKAEDIALTFCHCRHALELLGDPCSKPKDVCIAIGPGAQYMVEYGMGKAISREELRNVLKRAEDAGLVHMVNNTSKNISFICNCCICHCDILKSFKRVPDRAGAARSSFIAEVDTVECTGCGSCLERCPMEALSIQDEVAVIADKGCIGCGLCVSVCPTRAISLLPRGEASVPYADAKQLNEAIVSSMGSKVM